MRHLVKFPADLSNHCGDMAVFQRFKMAAVRHFGFVIPCLDHPRRVFVGICHCAKFGRNRL